MEELHDELIYIHHLSSIIWLTIGWTARVQIPLGFCYSPTTYRMALGPCQPLILCTRHSCEVPI